MTDCARQLSIMPGPASRSGAGDAGRRLLGALWLLAALLIAVFAAPAVSAQALDAYLLGPGDRLKVTVFGHPQESGEFEVDSLGNVSYPLLGRVEARGRTVAELQAHISEALNKSYIVDPRVTVEILNYRPFYIYGEVNRAGSYPYVAGLTVRRAVAIAGGFTRRARQAPVLLVRETAEGIAKSEVGIDVPVLPGDIIEVDRRLF